MKDDKSPLYLVFTKEEFPKVLTCRKTDLESSNNYADVFGPYQSAAQTIAVLRTIRRIFPFCNAQRLKNNQRPCFYYHLHLCPGVCVGKISQSEYSEILNNLANFFSILVS